MELKKNACLTLTVGGYSADGFGVARTEDGAVVFVKGALAGETCAVRLLKVGKSAAWAGLERVLVPSPMRVEPDCPHFGRCGGCAFRHMTYEEELRAKRQRAEEALRRVGGLELPLDAVYGAREPLCYRNKARYLVSPGPKGPRVGFYRARSHDVIPVERCLLQHPAADAAARAVRRWMARYEVPAYDEGADAGLLRQIYVRVNRAGQALVCLQSAQGRLPNRAALTDMLRAECPSMVGLVQEAGRAAGGAVRDGRRFLLWGQDFLMDELCGLRFRLSVPTFYQVNHAQTEVLYGLAREYAGLSGGELLLDLYCGAGTIGLSLAGAAGRVVGVETTASAVEDARENARRNGIGHAEFFRADAGEAAARFAAGGLCPDVIVVDPPRRGLSPAVIEAAAAMSPARVVYISCDPATLARDLKLFTAAGYAPRRAAAVDLFPRTSSIECAALLERAR